MRQMIDTINELLRDDPLKLALILLAAGLIAALVMWRIAYWQAVITIAQELIRR